MTIPIIQQTDSWLVVNKPAGVSVHDEAETPGLVTRLKKQMKLDYLALIHRLDKVTSGCLLLAKNPQTAAFLAKQFQQRKVEKRYIALTKGKPKKKQGRIVGDMSAARNGNYKLLKSRHDPAITEFTSLGFDGQLRLALVKILTGKTHQIRVAMKSMGSPIWGDRRYGGVEHEAADRCYLHHYRLGFSDELNHKVTVECLPDSGEVFQQAEFLALLNGNANSL